MDDDEFAAECRRRAAAYRAAADQLELAANVGRLVGGQILTTDPRPVPNFNRVVGVTLPPQERARGHVESGSQTDRAIQTIRAHGGPLHASKIAEALGVTDTNALASQIRKAADRGHFVRVSPGVWTLPELAKEGEPTT